MRSWWGRAATFAPFEGDGIVHETYFTLPFVVVRDVAILPESVSHFDLGRKKSVKTVETAMLSDSKLFIAAQRDGRQEEVPLTTREIYPIGTVISITQAIHLKDHIVRLWVRGEKKARLVQIHDQGNYLQADISLLDEPADELDDETEEAMIRSLLETLMEYCSVNQSESKGIAEQIDGISGLDVLINVLGTTLSMNFSIKQKLLESDSLREKFNLLQAFLLRETSVLRIKTDLQKKVQERVDKNQKEYILREQMKAIREELGDDEASEADEFEERLKQLEAPDNIKSRIAREIENFRNTSGFNAESTVSRNYIETLLTIPWQKASEDRTDLKEARRILEEDHYGLEDVKKRIMEYLAVRSLTNSGETPIICLVGPPGTGKTSIAKSIARALDKKYVRIGLGGVRDEAEIRGHRRTYIGAIPGRVIQEMRYAGVCNPVMLLDEVDKTGSDYKGDVASALLELLDPEQNKQYVDHYVELPVDMSNVLFIATANDRSMIPQPLLDRMELIEISSYTSNEKLHIAKEHLIKKQCSANGLKPDQLTISEAALLHIIEGYTREAGVRGLERKIGSICRKAASEIFEKKKKRVSVTEHNLVRYLGHEKYETETVYHEDDVGVVCGLAWTSVGGTTLEIETNVMPGSGDVKLTGQLGDVMKESAEAGISYIRSISDSQNIDQEYFANHDIHIHIPEGGVPKDGPSAGITMATAIYSAITGEPVRGDVAMTGEITLRGRALPIGGLKEKLLAAKNAGMTIVCLPEKNKMDVADFSPEVTKGLSLKYVSTMDQVLDIALVGHNSK